MIILKSRLETLQTYLTEAMLKPTLNKLYIQDLELSIKMETKHPMDAHSYAEWVHA